MQQFQFHVRVMLKYQKNQRNVEDCFKYDGGKTLGLLLAGKSEMWDVMWLLFLKVIVTRAIVIVTTAIFFYESKCQLKY